MADRFILKALDYMQVQLALLDELKPVQLFIRGTYPLGNVPQNPYCEMFATRADDNRADYALQREGILYSGGIRFIDRLTENSGFTNWVNVGEGRYIKLPGYTRVANFAIAARNELMRCTHRDLGGLDIDDEVACEFTIEQNSLGLGLEQGQKQNTWYDVSELRFSIRAQREVQA